MVVACILFSLSYFKILKSLALYLQHFLLSRLILLTGFQGCVLMLKATEGSKLLRNVSH